MKKDKLTAVQRRAPWLFSISMMILAVLLWFVIHWIWLSLSLGLLSVFSMTGFIAQEEYFKAEKEGWVGESVKIKKPKKSKKKDDNKES